ncbi:NCS2 family permease [Paramagnetospirillum magneticum]|uniref:Permease n=1 Tax=Paramagnetospirillum magneticum (strain ATCC 700264 / AMB-1) TaxID=342108 RepID=Q2VZ12_PARM1|nr:NCS2 family permease [Paramagnetospirillum magneticum]BAE53163.1 Permease [Paramagnetospirillum magneticum AMB-1]
MLQRLFDLSGHRTSLRTECLAGATTFLTMAYIIFVNPAMLAEAGMDKGAVFVATCLAAALGSAAMGLLANYPIALAPGMGLNAYFTYGVVIGMGVPWPVALGAVFVSGVLFLVLALTRVREAIINAVPQSLKLAISAGIGLFLGLIAFESAGLVEGHKATLVTLGHLGRPEPLLAAAGFVAMVGLEARRVPGAIMIGILGTAAAGMALGVTPFGGIAAWPPSLAPTFLKMDVAGALNLGLVTIVFALLFVDLFDNAGTLIGLAHRAGMLDARGRLPRLGRALIADSLAAMAGGALGTSTTTSYIESASGINAGGRTGLAAVVTGLLFAAALFLAPLAAAIPAYATAPALLFVACLMARSLADIAWDDVTEAVPAVVTALAMPFTFSIAHGISLGFITFAAVKLLGGKARDVGPAVWLLAGAFVLKFVLLGSV